MIVNIPFLVYLISSFTCTTQKIHKFVYCIRDEPIEKTWICSCYMNRNNYYNDENPSYNYKEIYGKIEHSIYIQNCGNNEIICDNRHIPIFIFKYDDKYAYRLLFDKSRRDIDTDDSLSMLVGSGYESVSDIDTDSNTDSDTDTDTNTDTVIVTDTDTVIDDTVIDLFSLINFIPSNVSFLSIEYTSPMMKESIILQLPQNIYMVGTQILSAVFIARLLEYTIGENDYFDMDYRLNILDNNIQYISLLSNQYIELYDNEYKIKDI